MSFLSLLPKVRERIRPPVAVVLGSPRPIAELVRMIDSPEPVTCYQQDLFQAERLQAELYSVAANAQVETLPDLWDMPGSFGTVIFPIVPLMERELKIDMMDQAYHILQEGGLLITLVEKPGDQLCPRWHKKIFGQCSELPLTREGGVYWSTRKGEHERRRHEQTFHAKIGTGPSLSFFSQPGVFSYGKLDDGARALLEIADMQPTDHILDLGCGVGANGILAAYKAGEGARVTFVDSNVRAIALTERNARANNLTDFRTIATPNVSGMTPGEFDLVLANPPYYSQMSIARTFVQGARPLLKQGGRFVIVTKQPDQMVSILQESFEDIGVAERRGYAVFEAIA